MSHLDQEIETVPVSLEENIGKLLGLTISYLKKQFVHLFGGLVTGFSDQVVLHDTSSAHVPGSEYSCKGLYARSG
jgi:hypothetical protein